MTKVITRLYANEVEARAVESAFRFLMFPRNAVRVIVQSDDGATADRLIAAGVNADTARIYADRMADGAAVVMVRATYKPLGAPRIARETLAERPAIDLGDAVEETQVKDGPDHAPSVLKDHPRFLSLPQEQDDLKIGLFSREFGVRLLSERRERTSAIRGGRHMSRAFWPMPLVTKNRHSHSVISGGRYMSKRFWPMELLSHKPRSNSVIRGGALPFSQLLGWPVISRR